MARNSNQLDQLVIEVTLGIIIVLIIAFMAGVTALVWAEVLK